MENKEILEEEKKEEEKVIEENETSSPLEESKKKPKKKNQAIIIAIIIAVLVVSAAFFYVKKSNNESGALITDDVVMASVNGEKITKTEYDAVFQRLLPQIEQSGLSEDAEYLNKIKSQVLEGLVNDKLLLQNAKKSGVTVTQEEVQKEMDAIEQRVGGAENLKTQILQEGTTKEKLTKDIENQIFVQKYLLANVDFASPAATEEEIKAFYDNASKGQEGVPDLESVSVQIKNQIIKDKQQKLISDFLQTLRESADINIF